LKAYWTKFTARIDALNRRERIMVLGAALVVVGVLLSSLLLEPVTKQKRAASDLIAQNKTQMQGMQQQMDFMTGVSKVDPDAAKKAQLKALQGRLQDAEASMEKLRGRLVSPDKMPQLLESILHKNDQLKLIALKTVPNGGLSGDAQKNVKGPGAGPNNNLAIFRHGAEITVEGGYLDILAYIEALEQLPSRLLWGGAALTADESGTSRLTFTVYTLSLDKIWLSI
jgi:MSHA biogenesis protein MshJ